VLGVRFRVLEERMRVFMKEPVASRWKLSLALALLLISGTALGQSTRKFYRDDPIMVEPETQDASKVANFKIDLFYDLMLNQAYGMEVMGAVLYLGNDPLRMDSEHSFFDFRYQCKMIDVRQLDPEVFLASDNAGEIIFAILTGEGGLEQKEVTIRKIFAKLQLLYADDRAMLLGKIKQLEMLSLLRGKFIQQKILEEERNMAVTIDIREDLRYQQGLGEGIEKGIEKGIL